MAKRIRRKELLGVQVTSEDGTEWKWSMDGQEYHWQPDGYLHVHGPDGAFTRVMWSRTVEGAVGYTAGLHDGRGQAQRGNGQKL